MGSLDGSDRSQDDILADILAVLKLSQAKQQDLASSIEDIKNRIDLLTSNPNMQPLDRTGDAALSSNDASRLDPQKNDRIPMERPVHSSPSAVGLRGEIEETRTPPPGSPGRKQQRAGPTSRVILTTYPRQIGIDPIPMNWGHSDSNTRGPVVVSRTRSTIGRRNGM